MKNIISLKNQQEFKNVYDNGVSYANRFIVMYALSNESSNNRIGISVSKKVGNSVVRHHLTRLVRESYRLSEDKIKKGYDIVIIARVNSKNCSYREIDNSINKMFGLHGLFI